MSFSGELLISQAGLDALIALDGGAPGGPAVPVKRFVLQAADAPTLRAKVVEAFAAVQALNAQIASFYSGTPAIVDALTLAYGDASLAGGGDGHTFVLTLTFVPGVPSGLSAVSFSTQGLLYANWIAASGGFTLVPPLPENLGVQCYLASSEEALALAGQQAVAAAEADAAGRVPSVGTPEPAVYCFLDDVAGAAKGTRFMGALIYVCMQSGGGR